ncbi:MAG TPA: Gp37 family protein [Azospirillum sp.]|nr:Gp37 family protein [Azospirillum sp.]
MILDLETAIVGRLTDVLKDIRVEAYPEDPAGYALKHPRGAVLVGYGRSAYGKPEALDVIAQERRLEFDVTILARNLRQHGGAYGHLDAVRVALTGWRPTGARKLYPVRDRFLGVRDGVWRYAITFATAAMALETAEPEQAAVLQRITLSEHLVMGDEP